MDQLVQKFLKMIIGAQMQGAKVVQVFHIAAAQILQRGDDLKFRPQFMREAGCLCGQRGLRTCTGGSDA